MFQRMMRYAPLLEQIRDIFVEALEYKGITSKDSLQVEAEAKLYAHGVKYSEENLKEYTDLLTDLYFSDNFTDSEIENHINLARKQEKFKILNKVLNLDRPTSKQIKMALREFYEIPEGDLYLSPNEVEGTRVALINHFISNQLPFIGIAKKHITIRDIYELADRTYRKKAREGRIGGKAAGMYLAYKILKPRLTSSDPEIDKYLEIPESYYFNSGIFSDFIDYNNLHQFHTQKYKDLDQVVEEYKHIAEKFRQASFPKDVEDSFREFIEKVGEHPLVLRSSSLLEDNFGYAFSGKYDSVFLANQGDVEKRLKEFIWGLKQVHMSTYGPGPILYRRDRNLIDFDEKMSVLVQKVCGRKIGDYYLPFAAGVAFSYSAYSWTPKINKEDGFVRLVHGLGTRAVDRTGHDFPRMIHLSHPHLRPEVGEDKIRKYSQKYIDVINLKKGKFESLTFSDLLKEIQHPELFYAISVSKDGHFSPPMFKGDYIEPFSATLTFDNFLSRSPFVPLMKKILKKLQNAYGRPVDVEFAWDNNKFYLLQCRTLATSKFSGKVHIPGDILDDQTIFKNNRVVTSGIFSNIEYVVYICPKEYSKIATYDEKLKVGKAVSILNRHLTGKRFALFGPGRWGSNDINLGVKVGYEDINQTLILGEIAFDKDGDTPEVSYGTHFFNDLVEAEIAPIAIFPDYEESCFNEAFFKESDNILQSITGDFDSVKDAVHVIHVPSSQNGKFLHIYQDSQDQKGIGFLDNQKEIAPV